MIINKIDQLIRGFISKKITYDDRKYIYTTLQDTAAFKKLVIPVVWPLVDVLVLTESRLMLIKISIKAEVIEQFRSIEFADIKQIKMRKKLFSGQMLTIEFQDHTKIEFVEYFSCAAFDREYKQYLKNSLEQIAVAIQSKFT